MKFTKITFVILTLVLLGCGGCSKVTFGYNHADWLLRHWINDYATFNAQQKEEIRLDVADYMRWHREYALPEYTAFLQELRVRDDQYLALSPADVIHIRSEISRLYKLTMSPSIRPAAHFLSSLDSRQITELRNTLAEKNNEERKETLSGNAQVNLAKRAERYIHFTEELVGHLSREQENRIREMSLNVPFITTSYIEQREARQARMIAMLNSRASEDEVATLLLQWTDTMWTPGSPQEQQVIEAYDSAMNEMIARISGLMTERQKDHLRKKISGYIEDFQKLHLEATTIETSQGSQSR
jgi:hypothetical protein